MNLSFCFRDSVDGGNINTKEVLKKFGIIPDADDIKIVQYVCEVASNRAALLVSICTYDLLVSMCTIKLF